MLRSPRALRRPLRLVIAVLVATVLSVGATASTPSPAGAAYLGYYSAVPVGDWRPLLGVSQYRWMRKGWSAWGGWSATQRMGMQCAEWSTQAEVVYIVQLDPQWDVAIHVLAPDRWFVCVDLQ
jgi:hypothetical protein